MSTDPAPAPAPLLSPWRWWVCVLLMLATVINYMDRMALNQMAKEIKDAFGMNNEQYSWLESVFSLAFAIGAVTTGYVVDRVSVRWVYPLMVIGWSVAGMVTGFAGSFWMLLTCRFMLGLFEAGNWPCGIRTTRAVLPPAERSFGNSLFQSGTALGAVVTPLIVLAILQRAEAAGASETWRIPFRIIGGLGLVWVALWFITIPKALLEPPPAAGGVPAHQGAANFADVFRDRRFWALAAMVMAVNFTWHGYRTWLPLYLREQRGYSREAMSAFTTVYYLVADVGSWTVGIVTLLLCKRGMRVHVSRLLAFAGCALLTVCTVSVPFLPASWVLEAVLLVIAFGALGLFPTYFALSQELSSKHQGKVTGVLGAFAHLSLFAVYPIEGWICDRTKSYEWVLGGIGVFPLLAFATMFALWPPRHEPPPPAPVDGPGAGNRR
ncbi:MAG: MFS transporter [Gemmata sp.]